MASMQQPEEALPAVFLRVRDELLVAVSRMDTAQTMQEAIEVGSLHWRRAIGAAFQASEQGQHRIAAQSVVELKDVLLRLQSMISYESAAIAQMPDQDTSSRLNGAFMLFHQTYDLLITRAEMAEATRT